MPSLSTPERGFPDEVDAAVRRALHPDAGQRWPDVTAYTTALRAALGERAAAGLPERWLPLDPELTRPGARPTTPPDAPPDARPPDDPALPEITPPRGRRRRAVLTAVVGLLALAAGGVAGWAWATGDPADVTVADDSGSLEVTVPDDWATYVGGDGWIPPGSSTGYPALSVGSTEGWTSPDEPGEGAFLGILPGTELPELMPQHPECATTEDAVIGGGEQPSTTVVHADCPGGVTVERVVQVAGNRLLWVQVRSADRATANRVLDTVETNGL